MNSKLLSYICRECGEILGGEWSEGHVATTHMGTCDGCGEESPLAHVSDWNLSMDGKPRKTKLIEWD